MQSVSLIVIVAESYNIAGLVSGLLGMVLLLLIASFVVVIGGRHCYLRRYVFAIHFFSYCKFICSCRERKLSYI